MSVAELDINLSDGENSGGKGNDNVEEKGTVCPYCGNDPCWAVELHPVLMSIKDIYGGRVENKTVRFKMYTESVKSIHGTCLGKGVRKKVPSCVNRHIKSMAPSETYRGFTERSRS